MPGAPLIQRFGRWFAAGRHDLVFGARRMRRSLGATGALLAILGMGIGAGASMLVVVESGISSPAPLGSPTGLRLPVEDLGVEARTPPPPATGELARPITRSGGEPGRVTSIAEARVASLHVLLGTARGVTIIIIGLTVCGLFLLLFARANARRSELAMRHALGASPRRILGQLLAEAVLVMVLGIGIGVALAALGVLASRESWPAGLTHWLDGAPETRPLLFAAVPPLLAVLVAFVAPLFRLTAGNLRSRMADGTRATPDRGEGALRGHLTVVMIAVSFALLTASGLLVRGFDAPGAGDDARADGRDTLTLEWTMPVASAPQRAAAYGTVLGALRQQPGVRAESIASRGTWTGLGTSGPVHALTGIPAQPGVTGTARYHAVSPGYFRAMAIPVLDGREFTDADRPGAPAVIVVNQAFMTRILREVDGVGRRVQLGRPSLHGTWYTIVGVVKNDRSRGIGSSAEPMPAIYLPVLQAPPSAVGVSVRGDRDPMTLVPAIEKAIREAAPGSRTGNPSTLAAELTRFRAPLRWFGSVFGVLAAIATVLATTALYNVISFDVKRRTREIGIRVALGAPPSAVIRFVLRRGLRRAAAGLVLGLAGAASLGRLLQFYFFGVHLGDAVPYALSAGLVLGVALAASWLPARRAARADPVVALRSA